MFGDAESSLEIAERFEAYKSALNKSAEYPVPPPGVPTMDGPVSPLMELQKSLGNELVQKALSPELLESVRNSLAGTDVAKDIYAGGASTPGYGGAANALAGTGGLQAYDLEAPAKLLAPRPTPLRNRIARRKGIGTAHQFKTITGFTGTGTGGVGLMRPGITEATTNPFGAVNYLRGPKISYAGTQTSVPYLQYGVSDQVSWAAQFSGQGYQDIRQLSQTSVLYSSMLLEERMLLGGRGTSGSFSGALASPAASAAARSTLTAGEIGNTANIPTLYVWVTAVGIWGESVPTVLTSTALSAVTLNVLDVTISPVTGALGYRVYAGTTNTAAGVFLASVSSPGVPAPGAAGTVSGSGVVTINFNGGGTGHAPNSGTAALVSFPSGSTDSTASATDYDGILSYCMGTGSGYVKNISGISNGATAPTNGGLNTANPGSEFYNAFAVMYENNKADPDEVLCNGNDRRQMSDLLKTASSSSYRITVDNAAQAHNAQIGALVTGLQNEVTGKMVDLSVHPWMPQGVMPIISWTLPLPDSNISDVFAVYNVQDYMAIEWPVTQFAYETSSYWYGTFVCYAPSYCGAITGITKV
jgi:hypothetical protein